MAEFTRLLNDPNATEGDALYAGLYAELHRIAQCRMRAEQPGRTLGATALVHEAWLRLQQENATSEHWRDRKEFFAAAAEAMRRVLVDSARRRLAAKRGHGEAAQPIEDALPLPAPVPDERLVAVHEVLGELEAEDSMKARIVKLRFFAGMTNEEIAALLEVSEVTVRRHWAVAKVWLYEALTGPAEEP